MLRIRASISQAAVVLAVMSLLAVGGRQQGPGARDARSQQDLSDAEATANLRRLVYFDDLRALRTFFERVDVSTTANGISRPDSGPLGLTAVLTRIPGEWEAPFEFVRSAIAYVPYVGSVRGVAGAAEAGAANSLDQALLLSAIMEARGVRTRLMRGRLGWPDAARLALGTDTPAPPDADDPWPRWLEGAADHWWLQAQREGVWVDLDPSFADAAPGDAPGRDGVPHDEVPSDLLATVRIELRRGDLVVAEVDLGSGEMVGEAIHVRLEAQSETAVQLWEETEIQLEALATAARRFAQALGWLPVPVGEEPVEPEGGAAAPAGRQPGGGAEVVAEVGGVAAAQVPESAAEREASPRRPSDFQRLYLDPEAGPWVAHLGVAGRSLEAGPFEAADLDALRLRVAVQAPLAPEQVVEVPWDAGRAGRLAVVVTAGNVSAARLEAQAMPMYRGLGALAAIELASQDSMRPPVDYYDAASSLRVATVDAWARFAGSGPEALGWAVLYGVDRVSLGSPAGRVVRQGLRVAAVSWRPPEETRDGALAVLLSDPITVGGLTGVSSAASLRSAYGLLQSAVLSQVLNRLADRAPATAFDSTLMAIGTGAELVAFGPEEEVPSTWPPAVRSGASASLQAGFAVLAPASFAVVSTPGWWQVGIADGETVGWVAPSNTVVHGQVQLGVAAPPDKLDSLLASLPVLHRASRWLASLPGSGMTALASAPGAACASATVAADVMNVSLPPAWPRPDVLAFCGPG